MIDYGAVDTMSEDKIDELVSQLNRIQLRDGMRTFAINGDQRGVVFDSCFVAMLYGEKDELSIDTNGSYVYSTVAGATGLDENTLEILSTLHFVRPTALRVACEARLAELDAAEQAHKAEVMTIEEVIT